MTSPDSMTTLPCPVCDGYGRTWADPIKGWQVCDRCHGTGESQNDPEPEPIEPTEEKAATPNE